jgi:hypothetical protein
MANKVLSASGKPKPPNAGKGRVKGVPNKFTGALKEMVRQALDEAGGVDYLKRQANESPTAFLGLVGKLLPAEIKADVDMSGKVTVNVFRHDPD